MNTAYTENYKETVRLVQESEITNMQIEHDYSELLGLFAGRPQFEIVRDTYIPACHLHKAIECVYVLQGKMSILVNEVMVSASEHEFLFIPGRAMHEYPLPTENTKFVKLKFLEEWLYPPFQGETETDEIKQLFRDSFTVQRNSQIERIMEELISCSLNDAFKDYYVLSKLMELFAVILSNRSLVHTVVETESSFPRYLEEILEYIHQNVHEKIQLKEVAEHIGITEGYCSKYIKKITGMSFVEYVNTIRINDSQRLLSNTNLGITEILEIAGFSSVATFNRVFKKATGKSPKEYRKYKQRGEEDAS